MTATKRSMMVQPPQDWRMGWRDEWRIGAGETEVPYYKNGRWYLRVFNVDTHTHGVYDFATDMIEQDEEAR